MSNEQLNEALAKWAGRGGQAMYPDYCGSLDAVATLEDRLRSQDRPQYQHHLDLVCAGSKDPHCSCWDFIHATARQRAEAMARTVGVWKEEA